MGSEMCIRDSRKYINTYSRSLRTANFTFSRPELHVDDESSVRSSAVRENFTSGRRPLGSSSRCLRSLLASKRRKLNMGLCTDVVRS